MSGFTSGARRRNDLEALLRGTKLDHSRAIAAVSHEHDLTGRINPILDEFRDVVEDLHDDAYQWLFDLGYIWTEWRSPSNTPFPVEGWQPPHSGRVHPDESQETGEEAAYWAMQYTLRRFVATLDGIEIVDYDDGSWGYHVTTGHFILRRGEINDAVFARISHATAVLQRIVTITEE